MSQFLSSEAVAFLEQFPALPDDTLLREREVATVLRCHPSSVRRMRQEGVIPSISFGPRSFTYRAGDVRRLIAERGEA